MKDSSIKDFLAKNREELTAIGILSGLATFLGTLTINWIAYILSFLMLAATALIWSEIAPKQKEIDPNIRFYFFKLFLRLGYLLVILYILLRYRAISWFFLFVPIFFILMLSAIKLLRKFNPIKAVFESSSLKHKIYSILLVLVLMLLSFLIAITIATPTNYALDFVAQLNEMKI